MPVKNKLPFIVAEHYEADIQFIEQEEGVFVKKTYRQSVPCIQWLNEHLAQYYDPSIALPVAQHEYKALELLSSHHISATPICLYPNSIVMSFCGVPFESKPTLSKKVYASQCKKILQLFSSLHFFHNDLLPSNLLIDEVGNLKVIDFTLSEFGNVKIMPYLPNHAWARAYQDAQIISYYSSRKRIKFLLNRFLMSNHS